MPTLTIYATVDQLGTWIGGDPATLPADPENYLRSATFAVARALNETPYGAPVADQPRQDATCAQAASWIAAGIDPMGGPAALPGVVKSKSVLTASVSYDVPTSAERAAALTDLCPDAYSILLAAGLLSLPEPVWSNNPDPGWYVDELGNVAGRNLITGPYWPY